MSRRVTSPEFIGRHGELEQLRHALSETAAGSSTHLLVSGEAGVGKSRFVGEGSRIAREGGWQVLSGGCLDLGEGGAPYGPFSELLRGWVRDVGRAEAIAFAGQSAGDLGRLAAELRPREAGLTQERWVQARIHDALYDLLSRLGGRAPVLVVLEDMHWADHDTLGAAASLFRSLRTERVALLATYRADELHRRHPLRSWLAEVTRSIRPVRLELGPFGVGEVEALIQGVLGSVPASSLVDTIHRRSDGNPFFAEELLASGVVDGDHGLSSSLRELLASRIGGISDQARYVLGVVAVAGRPLDDSTLTTLVAGRVPDLRSGLRELVDGGLLVIARSTGDEGYAFRHALVQEAAYEDLLPGERRELHRAIASHLEALAARADDSAGGWSEIAHHWRAARDLRRGLVASVRAGDVASNAYAFSQAATEYEHGLATWDQLPDAEAATGIDRIELLQRAARAVHLVSEDRRAIALLREAVALSREQGDPWRTGTLLERLGRVVYVGGDSPAAVALSEEAVAVMPVNPPTAARARALAGLGQVHMLIGENRRAIELCREAVAMARAAGAREAEGHALNTLGLSLANVGFSIPGVEALEGALAIARGVRNADDIGRAYVNLSDALFLAGQTRAALERVLEGAALADELGVGSVYGFYIRLNGVFHAFDLGEWELAKRLLSEATSRHGEDDGSERYRLGYALALEVAAGWPQAAADWTRAWALIGSDPSATTAGVPPHLGGIELRIWEGRTGDALLIADDGMQRMGVAESPPLTIRIARLGARAAADSGLAADTLEARLECRVHLERLQELAETARAGMEQPAPAAERRNELELEMIAAELARLDGTASATTWRALRDGWEAIEAPYEAAYCLVRAAIAHGSEGDLGSTEAALEAADVIAQRLGAVPLRSWLLRVARQYGVRGVGDRGARAASQPQAEGDGHDQMRPFGLTSRELEVLRLVTSGRTNRQIGAELFISENTAGVHVSNILGKLGVSSRTEAARIGFDLGLAQPLT